MLRDGPLTEEQVRGLSQVEAQAHAVAMGIKPKTFDKKGFVAACRSWFKRHGKPFAPSADVLTALRLRWPDVEAQAALLPKKQAPRGASAAPLPLLDARTEERFKACRARVDLPSRDLSNTPRTQVQGEPAHVNGRQNGRRID